MLLCLQKSAVDVLMEERSSKGYQMMENGYSDNGEIKTSDGIAVGDISEVLPKKKYVISLTQF